MTFQKTLIIIAFLWANTALAQTDEFNQWQASQCGVGDHGEALLQTVQQNAAVLEPLFIKAFQEGPDNDQLMEVEANAKASYQRIQTYIEQHRATLDQATLEAFAQTSEAEFVATERRGFIIGYRDHALAGLNAIATEKAINMLEAISLDTTSTYQHKAMQYCLKRSGK